MNPVWAFISRYPILFMILPVIILPFLMRFIVRFLILGIVRRKYIPRYMTYIEEGWQEEKDREIMGRIKDFVLEKLKYHFIFRFTLTGDVKEILKMIENFYAAKKGELKYSFTLKRGAYCFLLAFCDIYSEYSTTWWFRFIKGLKIKWFFRVNSLRELSSRFLNLPVIRSIHRTRLLSRLVRVLLAPLIGLPHALFYFIRSMGISLFYEGFLRLLYALVLMKVGYYSLFLYGRGNTYLDRRIKAIPREKLKGIYNTIKEKIDPLKREPKSRYWLQGMNTFKELMLKFKISPGESFKAEGLKAQWDRWWTGVKLSTVKAYKKAFPLGKNPSSRDKENLMELFESLGQCYFPGKEPLKQLRIRELLEIGYMAGVMMIYKLMSAPVVSQLAEKITVNMLVELKGLTDSRELQVQARNIREGYKVFRVFNLFKKIFALTRGLAGPYGLILTLGSPLLFQQLKDIAREYVYHKTGNLIIYGFEINHAGEEDDLAPILW